MLPFDDTPAVPVVAYIDGGASGNPGPAGYGGRIELRDGTLVVEFAESIGVATNNVPEHRGLLAALESAKRPGRRRLRGGAQAREVNLAARHARRLELIDSRSPSIELPMTGPPARQEPTRQLRLGRPRGLECRTHRGVHLVVPRADRRADRGDHVR